MASYTTPLSAPRRQQPMTTPSAAERALSASSANTNSPQQQQATSRASQNLQQRNAFSPATSLSSSSLRSHTNSNTPAGQQQQQQQQQQSGIPKSRIGSVSSIPTAAGTTGSATTAPGRRLQYQLPVSSRLDGHHFMASPSQAQQQQQQQQQQPSVQGSGNIRPPYYAQGGQGGQGGTSSSLPVMGTPSTATLSHHQPKQRQRPIHMGYGHSLARHASTGVAGGGGSSLRGQHSNTNPNTNTMGAGGMMTTSVTNTHTQMGTTTNVNMNMNTQTQTGTTNVDKPKTRKKDKPPKVPPPETIRDNTGQMSYNRGPNLGEGGFASCYMISDQKNDRYAAKVIQKSELLTHKTKQKLFAEIKVHQSMVHENIVKYYHCFEDDDFVYLVLELCESKTLMELIKRRKRLTEPEVRFYMKEIVAGCAYMHHHKVIHRDLKLGNVFLTRELHCRIGDFGLAAVILNDERKKTICGTPNYIAPEILFDTENGHSYQADIWSVGVIMYTLLIGKPPFQTPEVKGIYKKIRDCNYVFPEDIPVSEEARNLVAALLNPRPESRPSMADVLADDFFTCGYCPERLDRKTLYSTPSFVQEEIQWRERHQSPELLEGSDPFEADGDVIKEEEDYEPNPHMPARAAPSRQQQLHCDQASFEDPATGQPPQSRRSSAFDPGQLTDVKVKEPSSPTPQSRLTSGVPTRTIPPSNRHQQQQPKGSPGSEDAPRFHYGEQVRMEMLDGDRVTTEIRTINVPRAAAGPMGGRLAPNFQQYSQAHARLHKEEHNRQQPNVASFTGNDTSNSVSASVSTLHQHQLRGSSAATASRNATMNLPSQAGQMSVSRSGIMASGAQSFTAGRHESCPGMSVSVPTLPAPGSLPLSSRLPVPKTRQSSALALNPASLYQQSGLDHQPQTLSTPTRTGFGFAPSPTLSKGASSSPRPANSMTMGGSTPNLGAISRQTSSMQGDYFHQQPHSPSPISRRRSSDMASIQGGSTFGKSVYSRRQETINRQQQRLREQQWTPRAQERNSAGARYEDFMVTDVDTDMEMEPQRDHDVPQHLDLLVDKMSDMPPSPFVRRGNSQPPQGQQSRDLNGRSGGFGVTTTSTTLIQTVHGVERPASAMQRTFSQEREFSETNRGLESPRKVSRTLHSQSHSHSLSQSQSQSQGYVRSQPQQQHSFLVQSSQHGPSSSPNTPNTLKHHSSQPLPSPSVSNFHQRHNHRASREWPADMMGLGLGLTEQEHYDDDAAGQSTSPTQSQHPRLGRSSLSAQPSQSSTHARQSSGAYELRTKEMEVMGQVGGMATSTETRENMHMDDDDQYQSDSLHQQQQQQQLHNQKQLTQRSPSQSQDPYRYQFTSPLQRRNQEAKQQQQQMQQQLQQRSLRYSQSSPHTAEPGSPMASSTSSSGYAVRVDPASNSVSLSMSGSHSRAPSQTREELNVHQSQPHSRSSSWSRSQPAQHQPYSQQQEEDGKRPSLSAATPPRRSHPSDSFGGDEGDTSKDLQGPLEESSIDRSSTRDEYDGQGARQITRSNSLRQQSQSRPRSQSRVHQEQKLLDPPQENADAVNNGNNTNNNNNVTKQSNETTMAGMSSGGHSDEQDHVEVPSTSCVTTTSLSLISMNHPQQSEPRKQSQSSPLPPNPLDLGMSAQTDSGCREEVERYLRTMVKARQEGMLGLPESGRRALVPEAPTVFLTRWIKYERYGVGWHLANGVIGVRCNDIITLVLSPNGDDIEIIQMPTKRKSASGHNSLETAVTSSAEAIEAMTETVDGWVARDFYEGWDHDDFLAQLEHTYCRMNRYPPRFDKKIRILSSFRNYMIQMLTGLPPWAYEDVGLTRDLPFLTDFFQAPHVVARLSNGIVQVNFVDHTKVILSDRGRVLTFIDGEEKPRRLTMTVHQALTPEYFYDPKDEADQNLLIQTELDQIAVYQEHRQQQRDMRMTSVTDEDMMTMSSRDESVGYEDSEESGHKRKLGMMSIDSAPPGLDKLGYRESRPVFNPETDHDLVLFPRPKLVAKNRRRKSRYQHQDQQQQQDDQDQQQPSKNLLELDASQQELVDITTEDETAVISQLTFKQLHEQIVRRLRLAQRLLQSRRIELAEEQRRDRLEREQALREGGEDNKTRRERRERERAKEKGKKQHSSQEKEHKEKKERTKDKKSENQHQLDQRSSSSSNSLSPGGLVGQGRDSRSPRLESVARISSSPALGSLDNTENTTAASKNKDNDDHLFKIPQTPLVRHASEGSHALGKTKKSYDLSLKSVQQHLARLQQQEQPQPPTNSVGSSSRHHGRRTRSRTDHIKFDSKYSPPRDPPSVMRHYGSNHHNGNGNGHGNGNGSGNGSNQHNPNYGSSSFSSSDSSSFVSSGFGVPNERSLSLSSSQFHVQGSAQTLGQGLEASEQGSSGGVGVGTGRGRGRGRDASGEQDGHQGRKRLSQPVSSQPLGPNSPIPSSTPQFDDEVMAVGPRLSLSPTFVNTGNSL